MQLNTSRYRAALNAMGNLSQQDVNHMARILSDQQVKGFLTEQTGMGSLLSIIEQGSRARDWNELAPDKQQALIGFLRMKNTALLAQKTLTGLGRASREAMDIEIQNQPSPIEGATVGNQKLDSWQENLDQMNSRAVKFPLMPMPAEIKANVEAEAVRQYNSQRQQAAPAQPAAPAFRSPVSVGGGGGTPLPAPAGSDVGAIGKLPMGRGRALDDSTAQQFLQAVGGDPKAAKNLAKWAGWDVSKPTKYF
jgi:hypothetical protein